MKLFTGYFLIVNKYGENLHTLVNPSREQMTKYLDAFASTFKPTMPIRLIAQASTGGWVEIERRE